MAATFVVNAGSTSHKFALIAPCGTRQWEAQIDWADASRQGMAQQHSVAHHGVAHHGVARQRRPPAAWQQELLAATGTKLATLQDWLARVLAVLQQRETIAVIGHRIVHGGERFRHSQPITAAVLNALRCHVALAPLHNGIAVDTLELLLLLCPAVPQVAVFDTAFHHTIPTAGTTYALPAPWRQQGIRRFGFHGISHEHVAHSLAAARNHPDLRVVSLHLGGGCSVCAIHAQQSRDTSMGFTPLDGLVMGSRSGSFDPAVVLHQLRRGLSVEAIDHAVHHESGLAGLSGVSADMREVRRAAASGHRQAELALEVFFFNLIRAVGSAVAVLQGVDVVALTGGIGENDAQLQHDLLTQLQWLGIQPAPQSRAAPPTGTCYRLSAAGAAELWVVRADEEGTIAQAAQRLCHPHG